MAEVLAVSFAEHLEQIRDLRARDDGFAAICRDYETLVALLPLDVTDPSLNDIMNSLAGLEAEIRTYLACLGTGRAAKSLLRPQSKDHPDAG